jgi:hypothetical protein
VPEVGVYFERKRESYINEKNSGHYFDRLGLRKIKPTF